MRPEMPDLLANLGAPKSRVTAPLNIRDQRIDQLHNKHRMVNRPGPWERHGRLNLCPIPANHSQRQATKSILCHRVLEHHVWAGWIVVRAWHRRWQTKIPFQTQRQLSSKSAARSLVAIDVINATRALVKATFRSDKNKGRFWHRFFVELFFSFFFSFFFSLFYFKPQTLPNPSELF